MATLEWLEGAKSDLQRLYDFITPHNPNAAARAVQAIITGVEQLAEFPEAGAPWSPDIRFRELVIPFGARAYIVRYRTLQGRVIIVRVWHGLEDRA
ncbi:MAG: type II toxin-antitoxin system RelE/ParE family toxin [Pseudomonadota bacterium]